MDIDLLSKMVKELILDQDRVVLPGLGSFVAEIVPSTFSDKGYTINPPYRRLFFRSKPDEGEELIEFYASSNNIASEMAGRIIRDFLSELKSVLHEKKTIVFPGLGRLRATKENHLFFIADEDLDIYPEGFGLEPVSLKTHQETPEQLTAAVADLRAMLAEREVAPVVENEQDAAVDADVIVEEQEIVAEVACEEEQETVAEVPVSAETTAEVVVVEEESVAEEPITVELEKEEKADIAKDDFVEIIVEPVEEPQTRVESETVAKTPLWKIVLKVIMWLLIVALVLLAAFVVLGHMCPDFVDRLLYTPEEMEIVNIL